MARPRVPTRLLLTLAFALSTVVPLLATGAARAGATTGPGSSPAGLWLVGADGGVLTYGNAAFDGSTSGQPLNKPIVAMAAAPDGGGYWLVASDGGVFAFGDAGFFGSTGGLHLNKPIVAMAATPDGRGYWLVASDGGVFAFGDASFHGSTGSLLLNKPIVAMAATPDGGGYWLVASDGGVFAFGDAGFYGSTGGVHLNKPIMAMAPTPDGRGYWFVASDGGVFSFGDAGFHGAADGVAVAADQSVVGMGATPDGNGYWLVSSNGSILPYGDAESFGPSGTLHLDKPIVGMAADPVSAAMAFSTASPAPPTSTTSSTTTTTTTAVPSSEMAPPAGYTAQQEIFDDTFAGTSLNTSKWTTSLGAQGIVWNDFGVLPAPYSGPNDPSHGGSGTNMEMYSPSQVSVDDGLTLTAQRNTNRYSSTFPWLSGVVTTEGKFTLPTGGWYVQVRAKMPDQSQGMWPAIWFLPGSAGGPVNELDGFEGGWVGSSPDSQGHSDYFADQGQDQSVWSSGVDLTAGYHTYGYQFLPGQSITAYVDGRAVWQVKASRSLTITGEPYEIILELQVAGASTSGWHTVSSVGTPTAAMKVAEVQAYSTS